ncbi:MAG: hypothetical protein HC893_10620 [Chloroflexaceae bacterium]|nr:hypothetical protein [Chloroflexaceae bacterium]NJL34225.1 hypothetical protein [Chloroflexaceae bacterium]NJO07999.1 hypothetical protein [Chloroflexaceae bacterium]
MMISGAKDATLTQVRLVDIHGTLYYDLTYTHADDTTPRSARVGKDDIYPDPHPGDSVRIRYVMNVVTEIQHAS